MKSSIRSKLEHISERYQEITALLADPEVQGDNNRFRELSREYAQVEPVSRCYEQFIAVENELHSAEEMLGDPEMAELAADASAEARQTLDELEPELQRLLLPRDPNDERNAYPRDPRRHRRRRGGAVRRRPVAHVPALRRAATAGRSRRSARARASTAATRR